MLTRVRALSLTPPYLKSIPTPKVYTLDFGGSKDFGHTDVFQELAPVPGHLLIQPPSVMDASMPAADWEAALPWVAHGRPAAQQSRKPSTLDLMFK